MKKIFVLAIVIAMISSFSMQAHAALQNLGEDSAGNRLIYDSDLDITWYDYSNSATTQQNQVDWALNLTVNFGGTIYDDWRLPVTIDGYIVNGVNGTTTAGQNITNSEMGHLFYTELGNQGTYDTSGNRTGCDPLPTGCLTNTASFQNLNSGLYWSSTDADYFFNPGYAWHFGLNTGIQNISPETTNKYALAVRDGQVESTAEFISGPEPISSTLFVVGGAAMGFWRLRKKRRI